MRAKPNIQISRNSFMYLGRTKKSCLLFFYNKKFAAGQAAVSVWSPVLTLHHAAFFHRSWSSQMAMKLTFDRHVYWLVSEREPMLLSVNNFSCSLDVFIEGSLMMGWWQSQILIPVSIQLLFKKEEKRDSTRALDELTGAIQWNFLFPPGRSTTCFERLQSNLSSATV